MVAGEETAFYVFFPPERFDTAKPKETSRTRHRCDAAIA